MTDVEKIVWGALGAIAVYIVGQLLSKFFIEPLHELRKAVGEEGYSTLREGIRALKGYSDVPCT